MSDVICAIDPGLHGAVAFYVPDAYIGAADMPVVGVGKRSAIDCPGLFRMIKSVRPSVVVIEAVHSMPGQGVSSSFKFGVGFGMVQGVVASLGVEMRFVMPGIWKRHYRLPADKEAARARAIELWPKCDRFARKKDAGRAEAALLARFWVEHRAAVRKEAAA